MNRQVPLDVVDGRMRWAGIGAGVRSRVRRLNPNGVSEGSIPFGWHPTKTLKRERLWRGEVGKGEFIANYGRQAFEAIKQHCRKDGRRVRVPVEVVQDRAWEF